MEDEGGKEKVRGEGWKKGGSEGVRGLGKRRKEKRKLGMKDGGGGEEMRNEGSYQ